MTKGTACKYRDCERLRIVGWTTCAKHYSAGCSLAQERRKTKTHKEEL